MKIKLILSNMMLIFLFFSCSITFAKSTDGENLERHLFKVAIDKNWQSFEEMIAPEFQSINADKIRNRKELIEYVKSLDLTKHHFSNFTVTKNATGNMMVVTYEMTYKETVDENPESGKKVKNLSVWEKQNGKWKWVAHAVID